MKTIKHQDTKRVRLNPLARNLGYLSTTTSINAVVPFSYMYISTYDFENLQIFKNCLAEDR